MIKRDFLHYLLYTRENIFQDEFLHGPGAGSEAKNEWYRLIAVIAYFFVPPLGHFAKDEIRKRFRSKRVDLKTAEAPQAPLTSLRRFLLGRQFFSRHDSYEIPSTSKRPYCPIRYPPPGRPDFSPASSGGHSRPTPEPQYR